MPKAGYCSWFNPRSGKVGCSDCFKFYCVGCAAPFSVTDFAEGGGRSRVATLMCLKEVSLLCRVALYIVSDSGDELMLVEFRGPLIGFSRFYVAFRSSNKNFLQEARTLGLFGSSGHVFKPPPCKSFADFHIFIYASI